MNLCISTCTTYSFSLLQAEASDTLCECLAGLKEGACVSPLDQGGGSQSIIAVTKDGGGGLDGHVMIDLLHNRDCSGSHENCMRETSESCLNFTWFRAKSTNISPRTSGTLYRWQCTCM